MDAFDVVVIGAGPGGYPAAIRAAQLGATVAIVERDQLGGTCLNRGCIPTKALAAAAGLVHQLERASGMGVTSAGARLDYGTLFAHKEKVVQQLRNGVRQLLTAHGVKILTGQARFLDARTIEVVGEGDTQRVSARRVIIASGSTSAMPEGFPRHARVLDSRAFLELREMPSSLIVLGGGYIGCELACIAAVAGVKVTIVEMLDDVLGLLDADVRREIRAYMESKLGIRIITGTKLEDVNVTDTGVTGRAGSETLSAEMVLVAIGRKPVTDGLNLGAAGVTTDERGFIPVDDYGRTNVANIYAVGDVTGRTQLAHFATSQALVAAGNACGQPLQKFETVIPAVIFTIPEAATVGLTETQAQAQNRAVKVAKFRFAGLGKAMAAGDTTGFVKWVVDPETDQLLGAAVVGPHATELIAEAAVAVRAELTASELAATIHAHPTFSEAWMEAAHAVHGQCIHAPPKRR